MNVNEARKLTENAIAEKINEKYIKHIDARIKAAATIGKREVHNPHVGKIEHENQFYLSDDELKAVRLYYEHEGFTWKDYPDPDPGHPCGGAYTMLSW